MFDEITERNPFLWTSMIHVYVENSQPTEAFYVFRDMRVQDITPLNFTISSILKVFGRLKWSRDGERMFGFIWKCGLGFDLIMLNSVTDCFMRCGEVDCLEKSKDYFEQMLRRNVVSWTMMIDGYVKSGKLHEAKCLFDEMPEKNLITWSTMISGYAKNGKPSAALELFKNFKKQSLDLDETFILGVISACSQLGIVDAVESVISDDVGSRYFSDSHVVNSLIDLYAKCGNIEKALQVFEVADKKDFCCYSTLIAAFANHGLVEKTVSLFEDMQRKNFDPDEVTFLGILSACNHEGLVNEGRRYFKQMAEEFRIQPTDKHYACMVDILGRGGFLEEAHEMILSMHVAPTSAVWGAMLAASNVHRNVQLAEIASSELFKIEPENSRNCILLSNIYAAAGKWRDVARVRALIREHHVKKIGDLAGLSWVLQCLSL
ncbi:putative auxin-responsive protein IAA4-like [Capsicum annuum]|nr:putative auxin-responsive protein IAA4-like [Capsicum annuum]